MAERPEEDNTAQRNRDERCRNCNAKLTGNYCAACGQGAVERIVSLRQLIGDFFGDYFTFDSRLIRSVIPLVVRPGRLTNEYLAGRRVRYIPPLRLYLFISIVFFFLLSVVSLRPESFSLSRMPSSDVPLNIEMPAQEKAKLAKKPEWERRMVRHALTLKSDPRAFFSNAVRKLPTMMFVLLPLFATLLKLLYLRRRRYYVEHLIFSFHYHALVFLASIFFLLAYAVVVHFDWLIAKRNLGLAIWLYLTLYLVFAMRVVYHQGWFKSLVKFGILACAYGFFLIIGLTATFAWVLAA